jgi:hypothetical protein
MKFTLMSALLQTKSKFHIGFFLLCTGVYLILIPVKPVNAAQMEDGQNYAASTSTPTTGRNPWLIASSGSAATASTSYIGIYAGDLIGTTTPTLAGLTNVINPNYLQ